MSTEGRRKLVGAQEVIDLLKNTFDKDGLYSTDERYNDCCYFAQKVDELKKELFVVKEAVGRYRSRVEEQNKELYILKEEFERLRSRVPENLHTIG